MTRGTDILGNEDWQDGQIYTEIKTDSRDRYTVKLRLTLETYIEWN